MRKLRWWYTLPLAAAVAAIPYLKSQDATRPTAALLANNSAAVRVEFGVNDTAPRAWNGSVRAVSGDILTVRNWRPRPGDSVEANSWKLATRRGVNFVLRAWEAEALTDPTQYLLKPGVIVDVAGTPATELAFRTDHGNFTVRPFDLTPGVPVTLAESSVLVERVPPAQRLSATDSDNDFPSVVSLPDGRLAVAWVRFTNLQNEIVWREFDGSQWSEARRIPTSHNDIFLVKLGRDKANSLWATWSAQVNGNFDLYASRWDGNAWSDAQRLTSDPQPDVYHATATDSSGNLWVTWQGFRGGKSDIFATRYDGARWTEPERVSTSPANDWTPAIAADSRGGVYIGWDTYDKGNYDIQVRKSENGQWRDPMPLATTPKFEANLSLACDKENRLWAAWNESGMDWGKDTGFLPRKQGTPLYRSRWMAVAVYDGAGWQEPEQAVEAGLPRTLQGFNDLPMLAADGTGRVWLTFRHRLFRIQDTPADTPAHRAAWETFATTYEGGKWRHPIPVPFSQSRTDVKYGVTAHGDGLVAAWPTDNRDYEDFLYTRSDVYAGRIPLPAVASTAMKLQPRVQPNLKLFPTHYNEAQDLERVRGYRLESGGRTYRILRGDTHRHTEFSMDGNNDGSLLDAYRYSIDAAELDFLLVSEHNGASGPDKPYINHLLQQYADVLSVAGKFAPFYGYERSLGYPNGHRNVLLTKRGTPTLPIPPEEQKAQTGAKALYDYLKLHKGIAISHTSASSMGTDWRDNDPEVEPLVEIYQGDRVSAEYEGAPKAAHAGNPASAPGGFRPAGYVWNAWAKGYKLGVQAASDHLSTHISYACTIAEDFTREGLLDAMRARHSYGATDNIVLDYRMKANGKEYLQGDIVDVTGDFQLSIKVLGTQPIRQLDVIRSNEFLHTRAPLEKDLSLSFRDARPKQGESYYYVRVIQVDDQIAWSSPIWIRRK
jgi:hypothetical protein